MSAIEWAVIIGGLTAIGWVNWYFFMAQAAEARRTRHNAETRETS